MNVVFEGACPQCWRVLDNIHESTEDIYVRHDGRMEVTSMDVGRIEVDCVAFWACHFCSVVAGPFQKRVRHHQFSSNSPQGFYIVLYTE